MKGHRVLGKRKRKLGKKLDFYVREYHKMSGINLIYYLSKKYKIPHSEFWKINTKNLTGVISDVKEFIRNA